MLETSLEHFIHKTGQVCKVLKTKHDKNAVNAFCFNAEIIVTQATLARNNVAS